MDEKIQTFIKTHSILIVNIETSVDANLEEHC